MAPLDTPQVAFRQGDDIASMVKRIAREAPRRLALVEDERRVDWGDLDAAMDRVATDLHAAGIGRGDRVAILAPNSIEVAQTFLGALRAGACVVPLPTLAAPAALARMLADSGSKVLFAAPGEKETAEAACRGSSGVALRVGFDITAVPTQASPPSPPPLDASDAFDVIYSSGTTGVPKGIVHTHGARKASYAGSRAENFSPESVNVVATPFYSNTTCITWLLTTAAGGTNVVLGKFSAEKFLDAVERHRATHAMLVPVQYDRLLASPRFRETDLSSLRFLFSTSAPLRAELKRRILDETQAELIEIYGLTEGGPVTVLEARKSPTKLGTVGKPGTGCVVRVVDEAGRDVPTGHTGEVVGRSANMMSGYLNRPEETEAILWRDRDGTLYFKTGDIGRFDADGFLELLDRKKDVIISGGFNVYATDLETVLSGHPAVADVAVIGIPSERWGETPLALVVLRAGLTATEAELVEFCNSRVGKAERLSGVEIRSDLPRNAIGKTLKRELRAPYWPAPPHEAAQPQTPPARHR